MTSDDKPYSEACERNKDPILAILRSQLRDSRMVLEIGSGTGQHAVHFARHLPHLTWQTSDVRANHAGIVAWIEHSGLANVLRPLDLDVSSSPWPTCAADACFTANTAHIMSWAEVEAMFAGVTALLPPGGTFCQYGPFAYAGRHTSLSNREFDAMLRQRDPLSGIRDVVDLRSLAEREGLEPLADHEMPANNRLLVWRKKR